ncbi:MAG: hypothetical protein L6R30_15900 [Thermoanaerobaculia bacterium]|nr:hypothetical protein [Thermoanaerobaculia bacterium]
MVPSRETSPLIVGTVEIAGCEWNEKTREYEYILKNPVRFKKTLKATNQPQPVFWRPKFQ